jgi:hypothetical protein
MAIITKAVMGEFSGKLGNVVGMKRNGQGVVRAYNARPKNPDSYLHRIQQKKFSVAGKFVKPLQPVFKIGWKPAASGMTPVNAAMRYILRNALTGDYPDFTVDAAKVMISYGSLLKPMGVEASIAAKTITVKWADNTETDRTMETDRVLIAVHNPKLAEALCVPDAAKRIELAATVTVSAHWDGDVFNVYLGFVSKDGKYASDSVHIIPEV